MGIMQMVAEAKAAAPGITPEELEDMIEEEEDILVVDVRDQPELAETGKIAGAVNVSRGMLEFLADPKAPTHDERFSPDKTVIVYCATGGRAALAAKALKDLGYENVRRLDSIKLWIDAGGDIEPA